MGKCKLILIYFCTYLVDYFARDGSFTDCGLTTAQDPVNGSRLFVSAEVSTDRQQLHVWKQLLESVQSLFSALGEDNSSRQSS